MKRLALAAIILLGLTISCVPAAPPQPTAALATAAVTPTQTPTSTARPTFTPSATLTPTPKQIIVAVEQTPSPVAKTPKAIWGGAISSNGSRQYMSNGKVVNTCNTTWLTGLTFSIDSAGLVAGYGQGTLVSSQCSPHSLTGNSTNMKIKVGGTKDNTNLNLQLAIVGVTPQVSAEFGSYNLVFNTMTCPANQRTLVVPMKNPTSAEASLKFSGIMTGCAGSKDDTVNSDSVVRMGFFAECDKRPSDLQNPEVDGLCQ